MNKTLIRPARPHTVTRSNVSKGYKPNTNQVRRGLHAINNDIVTTSYLVGKSITLFTFFYTSLNWMMYKTINKESDDEDKASKE
jgi:hypothetical protein